MSLPVVTTPEAEAHISAIDDWWRRNRPATSGLFAEELAHCFVVLAQAPMIGKPYRLPPAIPGLR